MSRTITTSRSARLFAAAGVIGLLATGCTSNTAEPDPAASSAPAGAASDNDAPGETVTIGFSGPAADHGCGPHPRAAGWPGRPGGRPHDARHERYRPNARA